MDEIIDQLGGPASVAEMTGRRGRIVRHRSSDVPQYELRSADVDNTNVIDSLNVQEVCNYFITHIKKWIWKISGLVDFRFSQIQI